MLEFYSIIHFNMDNYCHSITDIFKSTTRYETEIFHGSLLMVILCKPVLRGPSITFRFCASGRSILLHLWGKAWEQGFFIMTNMHMNNYVQCTHIIIYIYYIGINNYYYYNNNYKNTTTIIKKLLL